MKTRDPQNGGAAGRALAERAQKGRDIQSGEATSHALNSRRPPRVKSPPSSSVVTRSSAYVEPEARNAMIAEAAYFRSAHRGFEPGHEADDWLTAESEIDAALARGDLPSAAAPCR